MARGGMVRAGEVVNAVLHGGRGGEAVIPLDQAGGMGGNTIQIIINAIDAEGIRRIMPRIAEELDRHLKRGGNRGLIQTSGGFGI